MYFNRVLTQIKTAHTGVVLKTYPNCDVACDTFIKTFLPEDAESCSKATFDVLTLCKLVVKFWRLGEAVAI